MADTTIEFRNPVYSLADHSMIDMEINHPSLGWIPFSASRNDTEGLSPLFYEAAMAAGNIGPYTAPPPPPYQISKTTPWLRMTEDEAATMDAVMSETGARLKQIYMAATYLASNDPLWATLHEMLANAFGSARADQLLAPEA